MLPNRLDADYRNPEGRPARAWVGSILQGFANLLTLEPNWDGENGKPIAPALVGSALKFVDRISMVDFRLPAPSIVPISDGGLQIEWHRGGKDFEIEFSPDRSIRYYYYDSSTGSEQEGLVAHDLSPVQQLLQNLL
jgi:hypothetical protein